MSKMSVEHSVVLVCFLTCFLGFFKFLFYLSMEQFVAEVGAENVSLVSIK